MLDIAVTKIGLESARIVPLVGQCEAARVAQHGMAFEAQSGGRTGAFYKPGKPGCGEGRAALRSEYERRSWILLTLQPPQRPQLVADDRMRGRRAALDAPNGKHSPAKVDLIPTQVHQLTD